MCECLTKSNFQTDATKNAKWVCFTECDSVTQLLIGAQDPNFDPNKPPPTKPPIEFLGQLINTFPKDDVGGDNCVQSTGTNSSGFYHILVECDFNGNAAELKQECQKIYGYLNPKKFLDETTTNKCSMKRNKLSLEIVANRK